MTIDGNYLKELRLGKGYSIRKLASLLYVSKSAVYDWETNDSLHDIDTIVRLCELYGISLDKLISSGKERSPKRKNNLACVCFVLCSILLLVGPLLFFIYMFYEYATLWQKITGEQMAKGIGSLLLSALFIAFMIVAFICIYRLLFCENGKEK